MSFNCSKNSWLPVVLRSFRLYTTRTTEELSKSLLYDVKKNRFDQALATINQQTTPVPIHFYNYILKGCAKNFDKPKFVNKTRNLLDYMKVNNIEPSSQSYLQLILGLGLKIEPLNNTEKKLLQSWFQEFLKIETGNTFPKKLFSKYKKIMRCIHKKHLTTHKQFLFSVLDTFEGVKLKDKQTWNLAISGCVNGECLKDAEEVLELACLEKVANSASYQIVIEGHLEVRDEESAHKIFKKMLMDNVAADMGVYETFMQYYIKQKEYKASETIKRLWQGILLSTDDNRSINLDIAASLTKYYRNNNNLEEAEQLYLDLKSKKQKLNTVYVNELCQVIIQFIGNRQYLSAVSLYCDLIGHGYTPIPETTDRIMQSSKANKYLEAVDQILNNFQK